MQVILFLPKLLILYPITTLAFYMIKEDILQDYLFFRINIVGFSSQFPFSVIKANWDVSKVINKIKIKVKEILLLLNKNF